MAVGVGSPVRSLCGRERRPKAIGEHREPGELDLERLRSEVEFVWAVVIVEPDDGVVRAGGTVVERVLDASPNRSDVGTRRSRTLTTVPSS